MRRGCFLVMVGILLAAANALAGGAAADFEKLKSLAGVWEGTSSEGKSGTVKVTYEVTSGGTVVMETISGPDEPGMVTMYHMDGDRLMMTHYCAVGNQPRMRARPGDGSTLDFSFVGATNMKKKTDGHMNHLAMTFQDADHMTHVWTWRENGKDTPFTFALARRAE